MSLALVLLPLLGSAQIGFERRPVTNEAWLQPFPAHRVVGDLYYVGTYDLAAFLITTPDSHILINTGVYDSADMIRESVESLGFEFDDIEILLTTQAHWDHVADLAEIKRRTGARLFAHEGDVPVLEDGGRTYSVLVVNMGSINAGVELLNTPGYPEIAEDYAATFAAQKALDFDVWVSSHGRHYDLYDKFRPGEAYDPQRFVDPDGYTAKIEEYEQLYLQQLEAEKAQRSR